MMPAVLTGTCPLCESRLHVRNRRSDGAPFIGCTSYPACCYTSDYDVTLEHLNDEIDDLRRQLDKKEKGETPATLRKQLRDLVFRFHPDRAGDTLAAHDVAAALNRLLDQLR